MSRDSWCRQRLKHLLPREFEGTTIYNSPLVKKLTSKTTSGKPITFRTFSANTIRKPLYQQKTVQSIYRKSTISNNTIHQPFLFLDRTCSQKKFHKVGIRKGITQSSKPSLVLTRQQRYNPFKQISKSNIQKSQKKGMYGLINTGILPKGINVTKFLNQIPSRDIRNSTITNTTKSTVFIT